MERPTHVGHPTIDLVCAAMRTADREDLLHYAGASYRDDVAWALVRCWYEDQLATERLLRRRALKLAGWT